MWFSRIKNKYFLMLFIFLPKFTFASDLTCLSKVGYFEARGGNNEDVKNVMKVVLNRSLSNRYPKDICSVVYQKFKKTCQFSWTCSSLSVKEQKRYLQIEDIAKDLIVSFENNPEPYLNNSLFFHSKSLKNPWNLTRTHSDNLHYYYK